MANADNLQPVAQSWLVWEWSGSGDSDSDGNPLPDHSVGGH